MNTDDIVDYFVENYDEELSLIFLKTIALHEQGGLGYTIELFNPRLELDGYEVDHKKKVIYLDTKGLFGKHTAGDIAEALKKALEVEIAESHQSFLGRVGWGMGKIVLGVFEGGVGLVGILVPEPGTTAAGVVVFSLGANTVVDGVSQVAGANKGHGYNILGESAGALGATAARVVGSDPEQGRSIGKGVFFVSSIAIGSFGSIRILKVPGKTRFLHTGVGGQPGGFTAGRLDLLYGSNRAMDGVTVLNINTNGGKSILRFVTHSGKLVVNGRIYGVEKVLRHETDSRKIMKGLLKLLIHGAKTGW